MGYYISGPIVGKADYIVEKFEGELIPQPQAFSEVPDDKALICVVSNGEFEAAGYAFSEREFEAFTLPSDHRPKQWLLIDKKRAQVATGCDR